MKVGDYLSAYQPIAHRIFCNAVLKDKISHAYLLKGEPGVPLKQIALFFAKSLVCDDPNPLACEKCLTCLRIEEGNYADFRIFDGEEGTIKKGFVDQLTDAFAYTATEPKGVLVYIIHLVENMTTEAVNALLKFLEEPQKNIYAILTTQNENRVLPTIISRAQNIQFSLVKKEIIINNAINLEVPQEDAELLANFYNDADLIKEKFSEKTYQNLKQLSFSLLEAMIDGLPKAQYVLDREIIPEINKKESARSFLDMLTVAFQDLTNITINRPITLKSYDTMLRQLVKKLPHIDNSLLKIMIARNQLDLNVNIGLHLDKLIIEIMEK